jgi:hypothetical protein
MHTDPNFPVFVHLFFQPACPYFGLFVPVLLIFKKKFPRTLLFGTPVIFGTLELSCCKKQQKKSQPRNWFGE